ncbi:MAG: crosslink repair DNA glycosylase YcaQ family protein, partial [Actinomycetota bacterium]
HAACYIPIELYPLFRFRMDGMANADWYAGASKQVRTYIDRVYDHVAEHGPLLASELPQAGKSTGNWWGWSDGKRAIETLFRLGKVTVAGRKNFARQYDITERVIPREILAKPVPSSDESRKQLLALAAKAHGIGTAKDLAGYFHIETWYDRVPVNGKRPKNVLKRLISELVDEGRLVPAEVEGWTETAYVAPKTKVPREIHTRALLSPFDPVMWNRFPTARVFGFDYQIEIYVPERKRIYGYYCLPFLLGDTFVGRIDLKADRKTSTLLVQGAFGEPKVDKPYLAAELADELRLMASWLELEKISVAAKGDLAAPLKKALK